MLLPEAQLPGKGVHLLPRAGWSRALSPSNRAPQPSPLLPLRRHRRWEWYVPVLDLHDGWPKSVTVILAVQSRLVTATSSTDA